MEKERENLNFQSQNKEKYNLPFKLSELKNSLDKSHDSTAGPDDILGDHENNCSEDPGSVCENCGADGHGHHTSQCKNLTKCINCSKDHLPKSNTNEVWLKEKAIMKIKVTNNISYLEAKKLHKNKPETTFSKIVQSIARPEMKDASTQYKAKNYKITTSTKVIEPKVKATS